MSLALDDVHRIAVLARIEISAAEAQATCAQLNNILDMIGQMQALDTRDVEPMAHALDLALGLREDRVTEQNHRELFQSIAPQVQDGLYLVPRVIE